MNTQKIISLLTAIIFQINLHAQSWAAFGNTNTTADLKAIQMLNTNLGYACGGNGVIIKTTDGGANWTPQTTNVSITLRDIFFFDQNNGWAIGESGTILHTVDGGANWNAQISGVPVALYAVKFYSLTNGYAVGASGKVLKTIDGGANWTNPQSFNPSIWGLSIVNPTTAWATGQMVSGVGPLVIKTTNAGTNWAAQPNPNVTGFNNLNDVYFTDIANGYLCGMAGIIRKTTDSGSTWTIVNSGTSFELLGLDFLDTQRGWAVGRQNVILHTADGNNWSAQFSGLSGAHSLWDVDFVNDTTGFIVTDTGVVMKYIPPVVGNPIQIFQPNGAEVWQAGNTYNIIWGANGVSNVKIEYSLNNGNNWTVIAANVSAALGSYAWTVPQNALSQQALVRISDVANANTNDVSNTNFILINIAVGKDYSVLLSAVANNNPASIQVNWANDANATQYVIDRKLKPDTSWNYLGTVSGSINTYTDNTTQIGTGYEYRVTKTTPLVTGYGYIYSAIELPAVDARGNILLLVDSSFAVYLQNEIARIETDLIGDGWKVQTQIVSPNQNAAQVKSLITNLYNGTAGNIQSLFLIGNVKVPYSGNYAPDGHTERVGAQPADCFYGDIDGVWTDVITVVNSGIIYNTNVPGDGRWDQSQLPSTTEIEVGRIDMHNMGGFGMSEQDLLKQYLDRNHNYRKKNFTTNGNALLNTSMDNSFPNVSAGAWRSFSPMLGAANLQNMNTCYGGVGCIAFIDSLSSNNYSWAYMGGGGSDTSMGTDVFTSSQCIQNSINTVFMQMYGSYFVEWNNGGLHLPNNLLRAPLASNGTTLATMWTGRVPFWYFHHMGLGETIGYGTMVSQNNLSTYDLGSVPTARAIHIALMGDPSLRQHIVEPVTNVSAVQNITAADITWSASSEANSGYHIYRANTINGNFVRINSSPVLQTNFTDANPISGNNVYMVRALKLETVPSGTYYNMSEGIFDSVAVIITSTKKIIADADVQLLPSPANNFINVTAGNFVIDVVTVLDVNGNVVLQNFSHSKQMTIHISELSSALYVAKIFSGNQIFYRKILVAH